MKTNKEIELKAMEITSSFVKRGGSYKYFNEIMEYYNIKFREHSFKREDFIGILAFGMNKQIYIMINSNIANIGRRNFTIAHELGHYFLNHIEEKQELCEFNSNISEENLVSNRIEQEANHFASCFLMPEEKIKGAFLGMLSNSKFIKDNNKDFLVVSKKNPSSIRVWKYISNELTKRYGVSESALKYRLLNLKLARFDIT